jgi:hypothetical protein
MIEITPRFALPLDLPRGKGDLEAPEFHLAPEESELSGPALGTHLDPTASGKALLGGLPQSQFFYADANGTGGTGTPGVRHGQTSGSPLGGAPVAGPKQVVQTDNKLGGKTVKLQDFAPPGWEDAGGDPAACFRLACAGASKTAPTGESPTGGGGIILYEATAQRIKTDKAASDVALEQIKRHIDAGRAVVAGVSEPASSSVVDAKTQPVTDHFVDINGYETGADGKIVGLYAKDNAVANTAEIHFVVGADGSITKPKDTSRTDYIRSEYQLSEVRFHKGFEYTGNLRPTDDAGKSMVWPLPPEPSDPHPLKHHVTEKI